MHFAFYLCISSTTRKRENILEMYMVSSMKTCDILRYAGGSGGGGQATDVHGMVTMHRIRMMNCLSYIKSAFIFFLVMCSLFLMFLCILHGQWAVECIFVAVRGVNKSKEPNQLNLNRQIHV